MTRITTHVMKNTTDGVGDVGVNDPAEFLKNKRPASLTISSTCLYVANGG